MDVITSAKRLIAIEAEAISRLKDRIGPEFENAVEILLACKGKVVISGMGKSGNVGRKIAATLSSTGTPSFFLHPGEASHGDLGMVSAGDVVVAISYSGESDELEILLPAFKRLGLPIIAMTRSNESTLAKSAAVHLDISVSEEACPMGLAPTSSTTVTLVLGDALAVALLEKRGFTPEDFAFRHPGGALGRQLILTVADLMHAGEAVPMVGEAVSLSEALIEMTGKRLGVTFVVNNNKKLMGAFTDGDLRRAIEKHGEKFLSCKIAEVMTKTPKTIEKEELAVTALRRMEDHKITSLAVLDKDGQVEGILHMHDLLSNKVS